MDTGAEVWALIQVRKAGLLVLFVDGAECSRDGYVLRVGRNSNAVRIAAAADLDRKAVKRERLCQGANTR